MKKSISNTRFRILRFSIPVFLFLTSCARTCTESALSDVILSEPELLTLEMSIDKDLESEGVGGDRIDVWVRDKNGQALTLKNGGIAVNGTKLSVSKSLIGDLPYYHAGGGYLKVKGGMDYEATITLGNGDSYNSFLDLPEDNLKWFDVPEYHNSSEKLTLSWNKIHPKYEVIVYWSKHVNSDSSFRVVKNQSMISDGQTQIVFDTDFFDESFGTIEHIDFTINSKITGEVNSNFRSDGFFNSTFSATRRIILDQPNS